MDKKGVELSLNLIIVAVMALLVLVVVVYLIANSSGTVSKGTACTKMGGRCITGDCGTTLLKNADGSTPCQMTTENCCSIVPRDNN